MRIAIVAAKFSDAEANELRKAMATFRRLGTIELLEEKMVSRMVARGYDQEFAERCFNQIKGFGEYGFPESHAASFAHLVYVSSWIKCHYPAAFAARCSTRSRWASTRRRRSCAMRASTASRCGQPTSTFAIGTARWKRASQTAGRRCGSVCARSTACRRTRVEKLVAARGTDQAPFRDVHDLWARARLRLDHAGEARRRRRLPLARASTAARRCGR